jgi:hypothetical protein
MAPNQRLHLARTPFEVAALDLENGRGHVPRR